MSTNEHKTKKEIPPVVFFLFFLLFTFGIYANSLHNSFAVIDDLQGYTQNQLIRSIPQSLLSFNLQAVVYAFHYALFGLNPLPLRILALCNHAAVGYLLFLLIKKLWNIKIALIASILFLSHPVNAEVVNWISGQFYTIISLVLYSILLLHMKFRETKKMKYLYFYMSLFGISLLLIQHPWMLVIIPAIIVFDYFILNKKMDISFYRIMAILLLPILALYALFYFGNNLKDRTTTRDESMGRVVMNQQKLQPVIESYPYSISSLVRLYIFPKTLTIYYDGNPLSQFEYILMYLIFFVYLGTVIYSYKKNKRIAGILIMLLVLMGLVFSPKKYTWYITERYLYMGSGFFTLLVAIALHSLEKKTKVKNIAIGLCVILSALYIVRTVMRNNDWKNPETLAFATMKSSPESVRPYNDLAGHYMLQNNVNGAKKYYYKALEKYPSITAMKNLGFIYMHEPLQPVPLSNMSYDELLTNGTDAFQKGDFQMSMYYLRQAYYYEQKDTRLITMLAQIYTEGGNYHEADRLLTQALRDNGTNTTVLYALGFLSFKRGAKAEAITYLEQVLALDPTNQEARNNLLMLQSQP